VAEFYLDSSALVKRYVAEVGTSWITGLCVPAASHTLYIVRISAAEIVAALFRRAKQGELTQSDAQTAINQFKVDLGHYQIIEVNEALINRAMALAEKHALRGYDAVQLAACLEVQAVRAALSLLAITFVCADNQLNAAAKAENLATENPNDHP
jgi:uncharacterized protein